MFLLTLYFISYSVIYVTYKTQKKKWKRFLLISIYIDLVVFGMLTKFRQVDKIMHLYEKQIILEEHFSSSSSKDTPRIHGKNHYVKECSQFEMC